MILMLSFKRLFALDLLILVDALHDCLVYIYVNRIAYAFSVI
jgi:hypothetical protein